jgi:hypothetical protein
MEKSTLIKILVEKALAHLRYDDAHPDVGWGMMIHTAVDLAEKDTLEEAARWNTLEALRLDFNSIRDEVVATVKMHR